MSWWRTDAERLRLELVAADYDQKILAAKLGISIGTLRKAVARHELYIPARVPQPAKYDYSITESMGELTCTGDALVTADWHLPLCDYALVERAVNDAAQRGIKNLVIAGDWLNLDSLSRYENKQQDAGFEIELIHANELMEWLLTIFENIYISKGNHSERLMRTLGFKAKFKQAMRMVLYGVDKQDAERIHLTGRDYVLVDAPGLDRVRVAHTRQYSKVPLVVPGRLADRHRTDFIGGHRHHHAMGWSPSGYKIGEAGGLFNKNKTEYLIQWTDDFPEWQAGYFLLSDGRWVAPMLSE